MDSDRIRDRLREIAGRKKHVRFEEIFKLLENHIGPMFPNYNHHGSPHHTFTVGQETFCIAEPKKAFVKKPYVDAFLDAMAAVGLFEQEGDDEKS